MTNIIFDTNILFHSNDRGYDYSTFKLNSRFYNVINKIYELGFNNCVKVLIPRVVFEELKKQQIDSYFEAKKNILGYKNQFKNIPNLKLDLTQLEDLDYDKYLSVRLEEYINSLTNNEVKISILELPTNNRFQNIIQRAYNKIAPFEGKSKESDKGFKDALLWESILEYSEINSDENFFLYSTDKKFGELTGEFKEKFNKELIIVKKIDDISNELPKYELFTEMRTQPLSDTSMKNLIEDFLLSSQNLTLAFGGWDYYDSYISFIELTDINEILKIVNYSLGEKIDSYLVRGKVSFSIQDDDYDSNFDEKAEIELFYSTTEKIFKISSLDMESTSYGLTVGAKEDGTFFE